MKEPHVITSLQHPFVKHLVKLRTDSSYRNEQQLLLLEGLKPVQELSRFVKKLFFTPAYATYAASLPGEKWEITDAILKKISGCLRLKESSAEIRMPPYVSLDKQKRVLALDGISDPGNLGTLLRTALALGWEAVYFLPGSCDPFNEKALRAARGAHFRLALATGSAEELQQWVRKKKAQSLVADLGGQSPATVPEASDRLLVLGNEAHGASPMSGAFASRWRFRCPGRWNRSMWRLPEAYSSIFFQTGWNQ